MTTYKDSKGFRLSKTYIDNQIRIAKSKVLTEQKDEHGWNFCEKCQSNGRFTFLDVSHNISVDECQKSGRSELAYDTENLTILCRECHSVKDLNFVQWSKK